MISNPETIQSGIMSFSRYLRERGPHVAIFTIAFAFHLGILLNLFPF